MEPIAETSEAVDEYGPFSSEGGDLLDELRDRARRVQEVVPECVGISVASQEHGVSFTLVASDEEIAALDAVQYVAGGPCVEAVEAERVLAYTQDELFGETDWQLFAQATAEASIASTLTLPIVVEGRVAGSVNLYGASSYAFAGHHEQVAAIFHAWAPGAVANADLDFSTRAEAELAPHILREAVRLHAALGIVMIDPQLDMETAVQRLRDAAQRAGTSVASVAERLIYEAELGGTRHED